MEKVSQGARTMEIKLTDGAPSNVWGGLEQVFGSRAVPWGLDIKKEKGYVIKSIGLFIFIKSIGWRKRNEQKSKYRYYGK